MTIAEALRAAAHHVEEHKALLAWDGPEMPTPAEKAQIAVEVAVLGHDLDGLASASETAPVYYREYEVLKDALQRRGFFLNPEIAQAIADAFEAERVAKANPWKGEGPGVRLRRERKGHVG